MLFIPLSNEFLYPLLEAKGFNIQPLRRMEYGMFFTAVAFFASTLLEYSIQRGPPNSISLAWQIPQITILTVAEILLNVTGLEVSLIFTFILLYQTILCCNDNPTLLWILHLNWAFPLGSKVQTLTVDWNGCAYSSRQVNAKWLLLPPF